MKERYKKFGHLMTQEQLDNFHRSGSKAWANKVKNASFEERKELLKNFTDAGNKAQQENRKNLTPKDYERLYPWASGNAQYYNCDFCNTQMICWFGEKLGKPRPKKRFCDKNCYSKYLEQNPDYGLKGCKSTMFYSSKMNQVFRLLSSYETKFASILESSDQVFSWYSTPLIIYYYYNGKRRRYYPDFLVNDKFLIEIKSSYTACLQEQVLELKRMAALEYCEKNNLEFLFWQFEKESDIINDERVKLFL